MLVAERSMVVSSLLRVRCVESADVGVFESPSSARPQCPCTTLDQLGFKASGNHAAFRWYSGGEGPD